MVLLAENARIPVDDPNTHLELTMIHEVMVLDHSGPDLALILYGASLKLFLLGALVVRLALGFPFGSPWLALLGLPRGHGRSSRWWSGVIESTMARLRMNRVPQLLVARRGALDLRPRPAPAVTRCPSGPASSSCWWWCSTCVVLATSRLRGAIRTVALQGAALSVLPLLLGHRRSTRPSTWWRWRSARWW